MAGNLLNQWGRWQNQHGNVKMESARETGQLTKPNGTISRDSFNEVIMFEIDSVLRSDRLTQRQKDVAKLEWKIQRHVIGMDDQEQRTRVFNRRNPLKTINVNIYRKLVRSIKFIVADRLTTKKDMLILERTEIKNTLKINRY